MCCSWRSLRFSSQKEVVEYYGHSWKYIKRHYHVSRCWSCCGYIISERINRNNLKQSHNNESI